MSRDTGRPRRAAAELSRLLEAPDHGVTRTDPVATPELEELTRLASALQALPVDGIRAEFRAALRIRLLHEACTLAAAPRATVHCPERTSPTPAFVGAALGPGRLLGPPGRPRGHLNLGTAKARGPG